MPDILQLGPALIDQFGWPLGLVGFLALLLFGYNFHALRKDSLDQLDDYGGAASPNKSDAQKLKESLMGQSELMERRVPFGEEFYNTYRMQIRHFLLWTSRKLPPTAPPARADEAGLGRQVDYAFGNNAMGFFLLIATMYPVCLTFVEYAIFNGSGAFGALVLFDASVLQGRRNLSFVGVLFAVGLFIGVGVLYRRKQ